MSENEINLNRDDMGDCRGCGASPADEIFRGHYNEYGTHGNSNNGWWLRIVHSWDYTADGRVREPDRVGDLLCPKCLEEHNERVGDLLNLFNI